MSFQKYSDETLDTMNVQQLTEYSMEGCRAVQNFSGLTAKHNLAAYLGQEVLPALAYKLTQQENQPQQVKKIDTVVLLTYEQLSKQSAYYQILLSNEDERKKAVHALSNRDLLDFQNYLLFKYPVMISLAYDEILHRMGGE